MLTHVHRGGRGPRRITRRLTAHSEHRMDTESCVAAKKRRRGSSGAGKTLFRRSAHISASPLNAGLGPPRGSRGGVSTPSGHRKKRQGSPYTSQPTPAGASASKSKRKEKQAT
ncbi:unnamed protein product [Sphacelaria rigidula]